MLPVNASANVTSVSNVTSETIVLVTCDVGYLTSDYESTQTISCEMDTAPCEVRWSDTLKECQMVMRTGSPAVYVSTTLLSPNSNITYLNTVHDIHLP